MRYLKASKNQRPFESSNISSMYDVCHSLITDSATAGLGLVLQSRQQGDALTHPIGMMFPEPQTEVQPADTDVNGPTAESYTFYSRDG